MNERRARLLRIGARIFVVVALACFAIALVDAWKATDGVLPPVWRLGAAVGLWCIGLLAASLGWMILLGERRFEIAAGQLVSQLAKYVPGGIWQPAGQIGLARTAGVPLRRSVVAFTVSVIIAVASGGAFMALLAATWGDASPLVRVLLYVGAAAAVLLLDRRWMVFLLARIPRTRGESGELVPRQRAIFAAAAAFVVSLLTAAVSYYVLLGSFGRVDDPLLVIAGFVTAWTAGFVVVPVPSGLGIREAVLAATLAGMFVPSVLIAASVYQRLTALAAEGLLAAAVTPGLRRRQRARVAAQSTAAAPEAEPAAGT